MKKTLTTCALLAFLVSSAALAGSAGLATSGFTSKTCALDPTNAGFGVSASGMARFLSGPRGEAMGVKVQAELEDKTLLIVSVGTKDGKSFDVGVIEMFLGVGVWEVQTWRDLLSKAFPVDNIATVSVREKDSMLLFGNCDDTTVSPRD